MITDPQITYLLKSINNRLCCINEGSDGPTQITFAPSTAQDSFGRLRVSEPFTLFDSSHRFQDNGLWATAIEGGSATFNANQGLVDLTVAAGGGPFSLPNYVFRETYKVFSYQPGKSLLIMNTFVMNPAATGLRQRVGYFRENGVVGGGLTTESNGFWLELADRTFIGEQVNTLSFVKSSTVTGSIQEEIVKQADWNGDKLDGTGPSGITLDVTKAQILWMDMEWLGVGSVRMGFVIDGQFILCHTFQHANIALSTYIPTASLPIRYDIYTTGSAATLKQICSSVISEGGYELRGAQFTTSIPITVPRTFSVAGTFIPVIGLRLAANRLDAIAILTAISVLGLGNGKNYQWRVVQGGIITGGAWASIAASSNVLYNITGTSNSAGRVLASGYINSSNQGSPVVNILKGSLFASQLERNGFTGTAIELTLEAAVSTTSGGEGVLASVDWEEISR